MALSKGYAVLEIQNILLNVEADATKYSTEEDLYLEVAKETYEKLSQVFRLVFEPAFNEVPEVEVEDYYYTELEAERDHLRTEAKRLSGEVVTMLAANEALHTNFKEHMVDKDEQIKWLRTLVGSSLMNRGN